MSAVSFSERRLGEGCVEIGVYLDGELSSVITHPCAGADWFWHRAGWLPKLRFKTKKAALEAASKFIPCTASP